MIVSMENTYLAPSPGNKHRRLSTLALANLIMMAGASKAVDTTPTTANSPSTTSPKTAAPAPSGRATSPAKPQATAATAAKTSTPSATTLNEVVVSAKPEGSYQTQTSGNGKYTEPLLNTPQTITVIPQQLIKDQNDTTLQQALQNVPGITFGAGEGGTLPGDNITIRGYNAQQDIFVDGFRDTGIYNRDPFNLEQVEVVEGPASAYSGYGSTGGSVNLVSKTPNLTPSYEADSGYGTNQYYRETADINQPLTGLIPNAAFRLNALYQYNNFSERDYIYNSRWGANPELSFGLGTDTRLTISYLFLQEQDLPTFGVPLVNATAAAANPNLAGDVNHVAPVDYSNLYGLVNRDYENTTTHMPTVTFEHDFDTNLKLTNLSRYAQTYLDEITTPPRFDTGLNYNPDGTLAGNYTAGTYPADSMSQELRGRRQTDTIYGNQTMVTASFDTWKIKHDFVATAEISHQSEDYRTATGNTIITSLNDPSDSLDSYPFPITWGAETRTSLNDYAFSMFDSITLDPHWILSGGMRYDHLDAEAENPATSTAAAYNEEESNDLASWRAALTYKPVENGSFYFGYGTSYNPSIQGAASDSSTPNGLNASTANLEPEMDQSYEFGTKWNVFNQKLTLTADFFRTIKDNTRIADPNNVGQYILAGTTRVQGIDVGAQGNLTKEWKVFAGYTYLQSAILGNLAANGAASTSGNQLPYTPNQSANFWTTYELPCHLTLGTGVQVNDKTYGSTANTASVPGYVTQQAMLGYKATKNVSFQVNVYNLWDEHYIAVYGNGGAVPGPGRSVTFTTSIKF
jgi:catecholate siderophore receptor